MPGDAFEGATDLVSDAGRLRSWARHTWRFYSANTWTPMRQGGRLRPWPEELIFTPDKLLNSQGDNPPKGISFLVFLSFPQGSHPVHSFCTSGECFSVAGCNLLPQSGFSENVGISQRLPNDDCGDAGGSWQFSRVNCQGKFGNARECQPVARALRPPPLPALRSGLGCWPPHRLHRYDSPNHSSATVLVKVALFVSAVGPVQSARRPKRREGKTRDPRT